MALNMFCCLKNCINGVGFSQTTAPRKEIPQITLDTSHMVVQFWDESVDEVEELGENGNLVFTLSWNHMVTFVGDIKCIGHQDDAVIVHALIAGQEMVIVKNGQRACGSGGVLASAPLVQSKAYFEVKLLQSGVWGVGLATRSADLNQAPGGHDEESWVLCSDGAVRHNNKELARMSQAPQEGDVLGVAYDHVELNFYVNGKSSECPVIGVRHTVYPAIYVHEGAVLDIILDNFSHPPPQGFDKIMIEQSLL